MIYIDGVGKPNLVEWVVENARDIERVEKELQDAKTLLGFDIKVIGVQEEWVEPTGIFEYGDAILVGPEGGPYVFHIYTRSDDGPFWLNFGEIGIQGPQGPQGVPGETGAPGESTRWYVGSSAPTGPDIKEGDCWLRNSDCNVYIYEEGRWMARANIRGLQGIEGPEGKQGKQGIQGPQGPAGPAGSPSPVVNILGVLDSINQLPDISDVPENAGYLIQFEGTNRLYIVINGVWTNSGTWGGGSSVYADNEYQEYFNADTKRDVITGAGTVRAYVVEANGTQSSRTIGTSSGTMTNTNIAQYWSKGSTASVPTMPSGVLITGIPNMDFHAANKKYVDDKIAEKHGNDLIKPLFMVAVDVVEAPTMNIPRGLMSALDSPTTITLKLVDVIGYSSMLGGYSSLYGIGADPGVLTIHNTGQPLEVGTYCGWHMLAVNGNSDLISGTAYIESLSDSTIGIKFSIDPNFPFSELYLQYILQHDSPWYFS